MTREDIIRMAQECNLIGMRPYLDGIYQESIERFAALVAAAERNRIWNQEDWTEYERGIAAAAKAEENEACAKVCEEEGLLWGQRYAAAIRARGNTQ